MKRKIQGLAAAAMASALLLTGCSAGGSQGGDAGGDSITLWLAGATLKIEEQGWGDLVTKLTTALPDPKNTPDVTEIGNTQSPTFTNVGAFLDLSDMYEELGGDDLLPSFVEVGEVDGKNYALPYYFGSRYMFFRKDVWDAAGVQVPTTLDEFNSAVTTIAEANPKGIENFSGFYLGGQDWRDGISWIFANGGEIAELQGDKWVATLDSPEAVKGIEQLQQIYRTASKAPNDAKDANQYQFLNDSDSIKDEDGNVTDDISLAVRTSASRRSPSTPSSQKICCASSTRRSTRRCSARTVSAPRTRSSPIRSATTSSRRRSSSRLRTRN